MSSRALIKPVVLPPILAELKWMTPDDFAFGTDNAAHDFHLLTLDVEAGSDVFDCLRYPKTRMDEKKGSGCLMQVGATVHHMSGQLMGSCKITLPFSNSDFGKRCVEEFWLNSGNNPGIRAMFEALQKERDDMLEEARIQWNIEAEDVLQAIVMYKKSCEFAAQLREWDIAYSPRGLSNFPEFDFGAVNALLSFSGHEHLGYVAQADGTSKMSRIAIHTASFYRSICPENMQRKGGAQASTMRRYNLTMPSHVQHDHDPVNDCISIFTAFQKIYYARYREARMQAQFAPEVIDDSRAPYAADLIEAGFNYCYQMSRAEVESDLHNLGTYSKTLGTQLEKRADGSQEYWGLQQAFREVEFDSAQYSRRVRMESHLTEAEKQMLREKLYDVEQLVQQLSAVAIQRERSRLTGRFESLIDFDRMLSAAPAAPRQ